MYKIAKPGYLYPIPVSLSSPLLSSSPLSSTACCSSSCKKTGLSLQNVLAKNFSSASKCQAFSDSIGCVTDKYCIIDVNPVTYNALSTTSTYYFAGDCPPNDFYDNVNVCILLYFYYVYKDILL